MKLEIVVGRKRVAPVGDEMAGPKKVKKKLIKTLKGK